MVYLYVILTMSLSSPDVYRHPFPDMKSCQESLKTFVTDSQKAVAYCAGEMQGYYNGKFHKREL